MRTLIDTLAPDVFWKAICFILLGVVVLVTVFTNAKWFWDSWIVRTIALIFGKKGARIFYIVISFVLIAGGIVVMVTGKEPTTRSELPER